MTTYERNENMEFGEQILRGGVALIMMVTVLVGGLSPALIAGLSLAAIYAAFTAVTGWEPLYALGGALLPKHERIEAQVKAFPARDGDTVGEHKKAA